ncbi:hypothetical protein N9937_00010 [bacterium]|nr:hypothetical protein [bacterium]
MNYFTLFVSFDGGEYSPQFGDYSRNVCIDEMHDSYDGERCIIRATADNQAAIDAECQHINTLYKTAI